MMKKMPFWLAAVFAVGFVACSEDPEEEVNPQTPDDLVEPEVIPDPVISSFSPEYGIEATAFTIQISGANFTEDVEVNLVNADGSSKTLTLEEVTNEKLTVSGSEELVGNYILTIQRGDVAVEAEKQFTIYNKATVDPITGSELNTYNYTVEQAGYILVTGQHFSEEAETPQNNAYLVNAEGVETAMTMIVSKQDRVGFLVPETMPVGEYELRIVTAIQEVWYTGKIIVEPGAPQIENISTTSLIAGEEITLTGKFFSEVTAENLVKLKNGSTEYTLEVLTATATELVVVTDSEMAGGSYTLSVTVNSKTTSYTTSAIEVKRPAPVPTITSINKTSFNRGEEIIITGTNLGKDGAVTNINFLPWPNGGTTIVRSASVNAEGTEARYTISESFSTGTYEVLVEVDGEYSESYGDIIKIN